MFNYLLIDSPEAHLHSKMQGVVGDFVDSPKEFTTFFSDGFKDAMEIAALKAKKYQKKKT